MKNKADDFGRGGEWEIVAGQTWSSNLLGKYQLNNAIPFFIFINYYYYDEVYYKRHYSNRVDPSLTQHITWDCLDNVIGANCGLCHDLLDNATSIIPYNILI